MNTPFWFKAAWEWLKKYWMWLLLPVGVILYFAGRSSGKTNISVVSPGLAGHAGVAATLNDEAEVKEQATAEAAAAQLSGIEADRSAKVSSETQKQLDAVQAAQGDPAKVTDLLKQIGKDIRGGK